MEDELISDDSTFKNEAEVSENITHETDLKDKVSPTFTFNISKIDENGRVFITLNNPIADPE